MREGGRDCKRGAPEREDVEREKGREGLERWGWDCKRKGW